MSIDTTQITDKVAGLASRQGVGIVTLALAVLAFLFLMYTFQVKQAETLSVMQERQDQFMLNTQKHQQETIAKVFDAVIGGLARNQQIILRNAAKLERIHTTQQNFQAMLQDVDTALAGREAERQKKAKRR